MDTKKYLCVDCGRDLSHLINKRRRCSNCNWKKHYFGGLYWIVLKRDNYTCKDCKKIKYIRGERTINVHHINDNHFDNRLENLETLCIRCHAKKRKFTCKGCNNIFIATNSGQKRCLPCHVIWTRKIQKITIARFYAKHGLNFGPKAKYYLSKKYRRSIGL